MKPDTILPIFSVPLLFISFNIFVTLINGTGLIDDDSPAIQFLALNKEYFVYRKRLMWSEARDFCAKCVGEFATFPTPAEALKVAELIYYRSEYPFGYDYGIVKQEWGMNRRYWFGLSDETSEGNWMWFKTAEDEGTLMVNSSRYRWYPGQPDHFESNAPEHCGCFWSPEYQMDKQKTKKKITGHRELHYFNDNPCEQQFYFICKIGELAPTAPEDPVCNATGNVTVESAGHQTWTPSHAGMHEVSVFTAEEMTDARKVAVKWHNIFRTWHNAPDVEIDTALNEKAQRAAANLIKLEKVGNIDGENLLNVIQMAGKPRFDPAKMVESAIKEWYFEFCDTDEWPRGEMNHFTQVVWKDTKKIGIGIATNKDGTKIQVAARYFPIGNYAGEYEQGVGPSRCGEEVVCDVMKSKDDFQTLADCPDNPSKAPKGRSITRKGNGSHEGKPVRPRLRPTKYLTKRRKKEVVPEEFSFWKDR